MTCDPTTCPACTFLEWCYSSARNTNMEACKAKWFEIKAAAKPPAHFVTGLQQAGPAQPAPTEGDGLEAEAMDWQMVGNKDGRALSPSGVAAFARKVRDEATAELRKENETLRTRLANATRPLTTDEIREIVDLVYPRGMGIGAAVSKIDEIRSRT